VKRAVIHETIPHVEIEKLVERTVEGFGWTARLRVWCGVGQSDDQ
jgi:hypothetical protein